MLKRFTACFLILTVLVMPALAEAVTCKMSSSHMSMTMMQKDIPCVEHTQKVSNNCDEMSIADCYGLELALASEIPSLKEVKVKVEPFADSSLYTGTQIYRAQQEVRAPPNISPPPQQESLFLLTKRIRI